jgi:hypothetical protein
MSKKLLNYRLNEVLSKLMESQSIKDEKLINKYINELNELWVESSEEMKKNAREDGFVV